MLDEGHIREVFEMLALGTESERQRILSQGLPEPPDRPETIQSVIADNTTGLKVQEESARAELE